MCLKLDNTKYSLVPSQTVVLNSNDPRVWGPPLWKYMHYSAANYPEAPSREQIRDMVNWLRTLTVTIPCVSCKQHYKKYLDKHELERICSSRDTLFNFLVDIHNQVNRRNNKKIVSYAEAREMYTREK